AGEERARLGPVQEGPRRRARRRGEPRDRQRQRPWRRARGDQVLPGQGTLAVKLRSDLPPALKYQAVIIEDAARRAGLDFFDVVFELLDAKDVNGVAAYGGFPVRHPSWRFGMEYERLEKGRQWGLSKIYELVINNDPTYAYLVRSNSLMEQKLV